MSIEYAKRPEAPRLTVTAPEWREAKCFERKPSLREETELDSGVLRASGLLATDWSKTASIFGGTKWRLQRKEEEDEDERR